MFAVALAGLVCVGSPPAALAQADAEASDDDGSGQTEEGAEPSDAGQTDEGVEPSNEGQTAAGDEDGGPDLPLRLGDSRRIDPFDAVDDEGRHAPHPAAIAHPGHDVVVCEAGCDKTAGSIVFIKRRE
jgi:hypothetical protein